MQNFDDHIGSKIAYVGSSHPLLLECESAKADQ